MGPLSLFDIIIFPTYAIFLLICCWYGASILDKKKGIYFFLAYLFRVVLTVPNILLSAKMIINKDSFHVPGYMLYRVFLKKPYDYFLILFSEKDYPYLREFYGLTSNRLTYHPQDLIVAKFGSFFNILSFGSYSVSVLLFSSFAFLGSIFLYKFFINIFPKHKSNLILPLFFIPTVVFWSSSYLKDSLSFGALGMLAYAVLMIYRNKKRMMNVIFALLSFKLLFVVKSYIALFFLFFFVFFIFLDKKSKIESKIKRKILSLLMYGGSIFVIFSGFTYLGSISSHLDFNKIVSKAISYQQFITMQSKSTSGGYSIGEIEHSIQGLIFKIPAAINVCLFRPYIWEVKNPVQVIAWVEAVMTFLVTFFVLIKVRVGFFFKILKQDYRLKYILFFSFFFFFIVGFITMNFGSLSRYKIPAVPFYFASLSIIYYSYKQRLNSDEKVLKRIK